VGPKADLRRRRPDVRFSPKNRDRQPGLAMGFAKRSTHPAICCLTGCLICPVGQITDSAIIYLSSPPCKIISEFPKFSLAAGPKSLLYPPPSRPTEGRLAIVTNAGRDAVDAGGAKDESADLRTAKSCGPDASTPASSLRDEAQTTVTRKPDHRGEHEGNR